MLTLERETVRAGMRHDAVFVFCWQGKAAAVSKMPKKKKKKKKKSWRGGGMQVLACNLGGDDFVTMLFSQYPRRNTP